MKTLSFTKVVYFIIFFLSLNLDSLAQNSTPKPDPMQVVIMGKGKVTKKEYDEFWQYLEVTNDKDKREMINSMSKTFLPMQEYQKQSWACAKQAWIKRKKVPCPKADAVAIAYKKSNGFDFSAAIVSMSRTVIDGAAKHKPVPLIKGVEPLPLTADSIAESEKFFQNSIDRLNQVLKLKYN